MADVFEHCKVGGIKFRNRILRAATNEYCGNADGSISDEQMKIYDELAADGVGGIITANFYVSEDGRLDNTQNSITDTWDKTGIIRLVSKAHAYGTPVIMQLSHAGAKTKVNSIAAMKYKDVSSLTINDLQSLIRDFIDAAYRGYQAGMDGVEIHVGHGYLLSEILNSPRNACETSPHTSFVHGMRVVDAILEGIPEKCGLHFPVWVKINCNDFDEEELRIICTHFLKDGVAAIEFSGNDFFRYKADEKNYYLKQAAAIRKSIGIPVVLTGGIRSREDATEALLAGVDMVAMSRPFISEPNLVGRWKCGKASRCLSCNKCFDLYKTEGIRCIYNKSSIGGKDYED